MQHDRPSVSLSASGRANASHFLGLSHPNGVSTYQKRYLDMPRPVVDLGQGRPVSGYEPVIDGLTNDPGDSHVLAAAIVGNAQVIVTTNLRHFPTEACEPYGIQAQHPDAFLTHALRIDTERVISALARQASSKQNPPISFEQLLDRLAETIPAFIGEVRDAMQALNARDPARLERLLGS
jgi:hypothetical protein